MEKHSSMEKLSYFLGFTLHSDLPHSLGVFPTPYIQIPFLIADSKVNGWLINTKVDIPK